MDARRLLREPIVHFAVIGLLLFAIYGRVAPPARDGTRIVVTQAMVDGFATEFQSRRGRPPTEPEVAQFIEAQVRDEVLYREGLSLGLDRDDAVIKRRVRQKLEVILEEDRDRDAPTDAVLAAYLAQHADRFMSPAVIAFEQVYLGSAGSESEISQRVESAKAELARGRSPEEIGQASLIPGRIGSTRLDFVARDFGPSFAARLSTLPANEWAGPVLSGFGAHLVRVTERTPAGIPPLEAVRAAVAREWESERRAASREESYRSMRSRYEVVTDAKRAPAIAP